MKYIILILSYIIILCYLINHPSLPLFSYLCPLKQMVRTTGYRVMSYSICSPQVEQSVPQFRCQ